jgi:hypothetical protein
VTQPSRLGLGSAKLARPEEDTAMEIVVVFLLAMVMSSGLLCVYDSL